MKEVKIILSPEAEEVYKKLNEEAEKFQAIKNDFKSNQSEKRFNKNKYSFW